MHSLYTVNFHIKILDNRCYILGKYNNLEMDNGNEIQQIVVSDDLENFENHASRRRPLFM